MFLSSICDISKLQESLDFQICTSNIGGVKEHVNPPYTNLTQAYKANCQVEVGSSWAWIDALNFCARLRLNLIVGFKF